jgi:hypothetical protein
VGSTTTGTLVDATLGRKSLGEAFNNNLVQGMVAGAHGYGASQIGLAAHGGELTFVSHKLLHGLAGAGASKLLGQDPLTGGAAGILGELVAEGFRDRMLAERNPTALDSQSLEHLRERGLALSRLTVGALALVGSQDVETAVLIAGNAAQYNALREWLMIIEGGKRVLKAGAKLLKEGTKGALKSGVKQGTKGGLKQGAKETSKKHTPQNFTENTQKLLGRTDRKYKAQLFERPAKAKGQGSLNAAHQESQGRQIPLAEERGRTYDHVRKVREAQGGLKNHILDLKNRLSYPRLPDAERLPLTQELSKASKLLDYAKGFIKE